MLSDLLLAWPLVPVPKLQFSDSPEITPMLLGRQIRSGFLWHSHIRYGLTSETLGSSADLGCSPLIRLLKCTILAHLSTRYSQAVEVLLTYRPYIVFRSTFQLNPVIWVYWPITSPLLSNSDLVLSTSLKRVVAASNFSVWLTMCLSRNWRLTPTLLVSGGFAVVQPDSQLSINAVEAFPLDSFSLDSIKAQLSEAQRIAGGSGSEQDIAEAKIEIEVCTKYSSFRKHRSWQQTPVTGLGGSPKCSESLSISLDDLLYLFISLDSYRWTRLVNSVKWNGIYTVTYVYTRKHLIWDESDYILMPIQFLGSCCQSPISFCTREYYIEFSSYCLRSQHTNLRALCASLASYSSPWPTSSVGSRDIGAHSTDYHTLLL